LFTPAGKGGAANPEKYTAHPAFGHGELGVVANCHRLHLKHNTHHHSQSPSFTLPPEPTHGKNVGHFLDFLCKQDGRAGPRGFFFQTAGNLTNSQNYTGILKVECRPFFADAGGSRRTGKHILRTVFAYPCVGKYGGQQHNTKGGGLHEEGE
jgi:hypothetical protein